MQQTTSNDQAVRWQISSPERFPRSGHLSRDLDALPGPMMSLDACFVPTKRWWKMTVAGCHRILGNSSRHLALFVCLDHLRSSHILTHLILLLGMTNKEKQPFGSQSNGPSPIHPHIYHHLPTQSILTSLPSTTRYLAPRWQRPRGAVPAGPHRARRPR